MTSYNNTNTEQLYSILSLNKSLCGIINSYITIDWNIILKDHPANDWPIESCIDAGLFDQNDLNDLRRILVRCMKKMSIKHQINYFLKYMG